jgi:hypothetical protein
VVYGGQRASAFVLALCCGSTAAAVVQDALHSIVSTKAGNRHVRWMTMELAWSWMRYQPESALSGWSRERCGIV